MLHPSADANLESSAGGYPLLLGLVGASLLVVAGIGLLTLVPSNWVVGALTALMIGLIIIGVLLVMRMLADEDLASETESGVGGSRLAKQPVTFAGEPRVVLGGEAR